MRQQMISFTRLMRLLVAAASLVMAIPSFAQSGRTIKPMPCSPPSEVPISARDNRINILILGEGFTREQCKDFIDFANQAKAGILAEKIFSKYSSYLHFEYYLEPSTVSGISVLKCDDPDARGPENKLDTTYGLAYCISGNSINDIGPVDWNAQPPRRAVDWSHVIGQARAIMPGYHAAIVLANGRYLAGRAHFLESVAISPIATSFERNLLHELGHALGWLAEEYGENSIAGPCPCSDEGAHGFSRCLNNVTDVKEKANPPFVVKWNPWYGQDNVANRPIPGGHGISACFHSSPACSMNIYVDELCAVCRQQMLDRWWRRVSVVEPGGVEPPAGSTIEGKLNTATLINLFLLQPADRLSVKWFLNNTELVENGNRNFLTFTPRTSGPKIIRADVTDPTPWAKDSMIQTRPKHSFTWTVDVPASATVTSAGTTPQAFSFSMAIPPSQSATTLALRWNVKSDEPGGREGDRWNILVANASSPDKPLIPLIQGVATDSTPLSGSQAITLKASSSEQTIVVRLEVTNGETPDFETTLEATMSVTSNCTANCDPCQLDPPAVGCRIPITVNEARLKPFTAYDEFFYRVENNPANENYNSLPSQEYLSHPRHLWFNLSLPKTWSKLRAIATALDANGNEIYVARDIFNPQGPHNDYYPFMQEYKYPYWWRLKISQEDFNPTDPIPAFIPDEKKTHNIQYRVRFFVTIPDGRVGEAETIVTVADPTVPKPLPLIGLYKAPMAKARFYNPDSRADMRYVSSGTYKWLQANDTNAERFAQGTAVFGQISGEHALDFHAGSPTGTDIETNLWSPHGWSRSDVIAAFDSSKTAERERIIKALATARSRVYAMIDGDNMVAQVRIPGGSSCDPRNCKDDLPEGYIESLLHTGKFVDRRNRVLDLTSDPRIGTAPWIVNSTRLAFDNWRTDFELVLDRCRLGEFGNVYCGSGRPPGTGKNMRIVTQPAGATISPGGSALLSVFAEGPDLLYQWYSGPAGDVAQSKPVGGATSRQITVQPAATTTYWVYVWNNTGNEKSNGATVTVCTPPVITVPPQSQTVDYGDDGANLFVTATGAAPLSYRWLDASGNVIGTGSSVFVTTKQTTTYTVEVTNSCGVARASATITVRPCQPPLINYHSSQTVSINPGMSVTMQVIATGSPNLRYRWFANGADTGVTTSSYVVTPSVTTTYYATVANDCGTIQSQTFTINVCVPPSITTQPEAKSIVQGQSATLSIGAGGSEPRAITWSTIGGTPVSGGATITVTPNVTTTYVARISNACGAIDSSPVTVTVCIPPSVTAQPQSSTITRGDSVTLTVTATGDAPLSYQWFRNDQQINGATSSSLTMSPTGTASYRVAVTNNCSTTSSASATVTVLCTPPAIAQQPQSVSVVEGDEATLSVTAAGTGPFSYQWFRSNVAMPGQTNRTLTVIGEVATSYSVQVTGACGTVMSDPATVSVTPRCFRPFITTQPQSSTIVAGQSAQLSVAVTGTSPFTYQWYANGTAIGGATEASYVASPTQTTSYHVVVRNACNTATSTTATVTVEACNAPVITTQPQSVVIESGQSATLTVAASGTTPLSYQWYAGSTPINGATNASHTVQPPTSTNYHVVVTNTCGSATSSTVTVTVGVCDAPSITSQPQSVTINAGQQTTVRVTAAGSAVLNYQWYANGNPVAGVNSAAYTVTPTSTTSYYVVVTNACGTVTSSTATVTVSCIAPSMNLQPQSTTIETGQSVTLTTTSSGLQPFTWQWYANGVAVPLSNGSALTVTPSSTTSYYVVVSNACGTVTSNTATVTVLTCVPARITDEPDDRTIAPGGSTTLTVQTTGSQPRSIEWRNASGTVIGTSSSITVSPASTTTYTVRVSNTCGDDSASVTVSVVDCPPPVITYQPRSYEVWEGNTITMEVVATSPSPLTYQWYANGVAMPGRTTRAIDLGAATVTTSYYVKVTNSCGTVQSETAVITVKPCTKPQITTQPQDVTIVDGESATFTAVASGTGPMTYQLIQQDMTDGGSNTTGVFTVKPPIVAPGTWWYFITAANGCGYASTRSVTVTVLSACTPPQVTTQPQSVTINPGQSATLTVAASGSTPQTVQWFTAGGTQVGTGTSLTVSPSSTTSYYARVSNSCGTDQSATATVTVSDPCTPPSISDPTATKIVPLRYGATRTLTVTASGTNLQYQWYRSYPVGSAFEVINGATNPTLAVNPMDDTDYRVRVSNSCGTVTSPTYQVRMWDGVGDPPGGGADPI